MNRRIDTFIPVLAIVDAFVGAISIVLILTLMSSPREDWVNRSPQRQVEISCRENLYWFIESPSKIFSRDELVSNITNEALTDTLSLRITITVPYKSIKCAENASLELSEENSSVKTLNEPPIFLVDIIYTEE